MTDTRLSAPVTLETAVQRGELTIPEVRVRKPHGGELRGLSLTDLGTLDVNALLKVLPRITVPPLFGPECEKLEPSDLMALGAEVADFLLPKAARPASPEQ